MNENTLLAIPNRKAWDSWRAEIQAIGVTNPLLNYEFDAFCQIDLDKAHPGGMAQFTATGTSTLTNLVRDPLAFSKAHAAAKRIDAKTHQLRDHFGLETCYMVGGLISLEADGFDLRMPILMWPLQLIRIGDDYEVSQAGAPMVNPALSSNIETCYGIKIDEAKLLSLVEPKSDLVPIALLEQLADILGSNGRAELKPMLALGNFTNAPTSMLADISSIDVPLLNHLASATDTHELPELTQNGALPVLEADETQRRIMARAVAGQSFAVETLPGCGYTQTVVNTLAALTAARKRTLVLAPRRQTLNELTDRLASIGLNGLLVRSEAAWMDSVGAISRNERAKGALSGTAAVDLQDQNRKLGEYFGGLAAVDPQLGVSVLHVLEKLAELALIPHAPETQARIARASLTANPDREAALALLTKAHELGEFNFGPQDSAWFQARFATTDEVTATVEVAKRLRNETFPALSGKLAEYIASVEFRPASSVAEIGIYLRLFAGIRESLDRFVPAVFDRSLAEVIAATSQRKESMGMSGGTRRRLKKLAKEFLRPGMHVADLNTSLRAIEEQREAWQRFSLGLKPPAVPQGINDALVTYQALIADLEKIQGHLDPQANEPKLVELPLEDLAKKLESLVADIGALDNLAERAVVATELRAIGLEDLMRDLARLHVTREHLASEFDLAWWQSALEFLVSKNPAVLGKSTDDVAALEDGFRTAADAVLLENRKNLAIQLGEIWRSDISGHPAEAAALKALLKSGKASIGALVRSAPHIAANLAPNLAMSPYEVAEQLERDSRFDVLLVLDAAGTSLAENLSGLMRAPQVITFGDDAIARPAGFEIEARPIPIGRELSSPSIQETVATAFGAEALRRSYRRNGQILGSFINREFYQNRIVFEPSTDDYWGNSHVNLEVIRSGANAPSTIAGANQSLDVELDRVVGVIKNHAVKSPQDSLLVVTASAMHADRIRSAIAAGIKQQPSLLEFFEGHGRERFEISTLNALSHRVADHVVFSLGYGKTPRGTAPSDLGDLTSSDGRRSLANLLISARKEITIVSCLAQSDIAADAGNGAGHLRELLGGGLFVEESLADLESEPMLKDLSVRLRKLGVTVKTDFGNHLNLIASYGNKALVLHPDWAIAGKDFDQELNLRPRLLQALGWRVVRVHAFELFADPERYARNLADQLGLKVYDRNQPLFDDVVKFEDTDAAWGEPNSATSGTGNDARLRQDKPPHWG